MQQDGGHPLDNPIWHALGGPHASLGQVRGPIRRYLPEFAPFAMWERETGETRAAVAAALPPGDTAVLFTTEAVLPIAGLDTVRQDLLHQMVPEDFAPVTNATAIRQLTSADIPAMMALVELTHPGPFAARTIEMGRYIGIEDNGQLIAMSGERLHLPGFAEVSAVCTHPDYRGRGLAKALVSAVAEGIYAQGEVPFLHVLTSNTGAIATYERLGFRIRTTLHLTVMVRRPA